jgi:predicted TPR repeat methyltransferase
MPSTDGAGAAPSAAPRAADAGLSDAGQPFEDRLRQAVELLRNDRLAEAGHALEALLAERPDHPDGLHFAGVLRHALGRSGEAIELLHRALAAMPGAPGVWNNLGNVLAECGFADDALRAFERSVEVAAGDDDCADALDNLGTLLQRRGRPLEAEHCLRRAVAARPDFGVAWYHLSQLLIERGQVREGLLANSRAITLFPRGSVAREEVIRSLVLLGEREQAATLYREWLAEEPDNPVARHQLAACLGADAPERASDAYVRQVFDSFASSFDAKLQGLHYRAPQLVAEALSAAIGAPDGGLSIADLGCGTGLCGPLLKPFARRLAGCDLSVGMLRLARARGVYDVLHKAELVYYLDTQPGAFDVIVSADTLCYFGALDSAMAAASRALRPGGWLMYTVERLDDAHAQAHVLQVSGRYAHRRDYLERMARGAGFVGHTAEAVDLRMEAGLPVRGWLVKARRPA